jgi:hypothetical protein
MDGKGGSEVHVHDERTTFEASRFVDSKTNLMTLEAVKAVNGGTNRLREIREFDVRLDMCITEICLCVWPYDIVPPLWLSSMAT